jgi:hypothetical protein
VVIMDVALRKLDCGQSGNDAAACSEGRVCAASVQ